MTNFEKLKQVVSLLLILFFAFTPLWAEAGERNEKPVMCADNKETEKVLNQKEERLLYMGKGFTKVRTQSGLAKKPVTLPFRLYVNEKTGTFTIIEHHPEYGTFCVIAYGIDFQDFRRTL